MNKTSLTALVRGQLLIAEKVSSGRSSHTVYGGHEHVLRQTIIALTAGQSLKEHANTGEATVHVLHGHVTLTSGDASWEGSPETYSPSRTHPIPRRPSQTPPSCSVGLHRN